MMKIWTNKWMIVFLLISFPLAEATEDRGMARIVAERVALVIGNSAYKNSPLKNPVNDARAMAEKLKTLGFEVIMLENADQKAMNKAIVQFGNLLTSGGTALFFFAGHGMQVKGKNFLIPVDAEIDSESAVRAEAVDVDAILDQLKEGGGDGINVMILDACRNNPFERSFRQSGGSGLAQMDAPKGTLIAYATAPGKLAADGLGENGLYTQELLVAMDTPGKKLEDVFKHVRIKVSDLSRNGQIPWESSSLTGDFYFIPSGASSIIPLQKIIPGTVATDVRARVDSEARSRPNFDSSDKAVPVKPNLETVAELQKAPRPTNIVNSENGNSGQQSRTELLVFASFLAMIAAGFMWFTRRKQGDPIRSTKENFNSFADDLKDVCMTRIMTEMTQSDDLNNSMDSNKQRWRVSPCSACGRKIVTAYQRGGQCLTPTCEQQICEQCWNGEQVRHCSSCEEKAATINASIDSE